MNDTLYEEYMRSVLGYQPMNNYQNTYYNNYDNYEPIQTPMSMTTTAMSNIQIRELEKCYPEIYNIIYPMIQKACSENRGEVTRELVDKMTGESYVAGEDRGLEQNRNAEKVDDKTARTSNTKDDRTCENRQRNTGLNDLIRILLLRELIGRPGFPGFRPPRPPPPPPPRPPRPPMRPPMGPGPRPPRPRGDISEYNRQYFDRFDDSCELFEY